jgi:hypothetical protein
MRHFHRALLCIPKQLRSGATAITILLAAAPLPGYAQAWKDSLQTGLEAAYPISKRARFSPDRVTRQGAVLVIRKDGVTADLSTDLRYSVTKVHDGQVGEEGGAVSALFSKDKSRSFKTGERVYVIDIRIGDRDVMLLLLSVDMFDFTDKGETKQTRYKAALKYEFAEGYLPTAPVADVKHAIEAVVATEADVAAASTKTIALGQTRTQVEEILGKPERIVDLGAKVMYVYKDMKVTFVDGKVTDVQ